MWTRPRGSGYLGFGQQRTRGVQNMAKIEDVICEWPLGNSQISFRKDGLELLPDLRTCLVTYLKPTCKRGHCPPYLKISEIFVKVNEKGAFGPGALKVKKYLGLRPTESRVTHDGSPALPLTFARRSMDQLKIPSALTQNGTDSLD